MYRIVIDRSLCSGYGSCIELAPKLFELDASGTASLLTDESDDPIVFDAEAACPMGAIRVVEPLALAT
jgi:ferredoxin